MDAPDASMRGDAGDVNGDPPDLDVGECPPPFCQWPATDGAECVSAAMPTPTLRPSASADTSDGQPEAPIYLGFSHLRVGTGGAGSGWGFDLDGQCTGIEGCAFAASCRKGSGALQPDAPYCADNTFARMLAEAVAASPEARRLGYSDAAINCGLRGGRYNQVMRLTGYNGRPNDDRVRVDFYTSVGLEDADDGLDCSDATDTASPASSQEAEPNWGPDARFRILENDLSSRMSTAAGLPNSKVSSSDAFVRDGVLVVFQERGYGLRLVPGDERATTVQLELQQMVLVGRLVPNGGGSYRIDDGAIAGRQAISDVLRAFGQVGVCEQGDLSELRGVVEQYLESYSDVALDPEASDDAPCDGVSTALQFAALPVVPGDIAPERQVLNCCLPQNYGRGACPMMRCGNGEVDEDEACDIGIAAGQAGACPTDCQDNEACQEAALEGSGCQARCTATPITAPRDGDGCCPENATSGNDDDCGAECGNGVVEWSAGETCDPPGSCMTADMCAEGGSQACAATEFVGSADRCNAECVTSEIAECVGGDGCCPAACEAATDSDCSDTCGDGKRDAQETCDGDCPERCERPVGASACTATRMVGSAAQCSAQCIVWDITTCTDGDGCCPDVCHGANDSDCTAACGNGIVEGATEECDDGNGNSGDGCDNCLIETPERICQGLTAGGAPGVSAACLACTCDKCAHELNNCAGRGSETERSLCRDVSYCRLESWCEFLECYEKPGGPCVAEIEAAGMSDDLWTLLERAVDSAHPFGRASDVERCTREMCEAACRP